MRLLLDENLPKRLKHDLKEHESTQRNFALKIVQASNNLKNNGFDISSIAVDTPSIQKSVNPSDMRPSKRNTESTGPFVRRRNFIENQKMQIKLAPIVLSHLRSFGASDAKELKLEFFFYSKDHDKANALAKELRAREYETETVKSADDNNLLLVTGWTTKMKTDDETIERWTEDMCELGYKNDCKFDGWGTTPDQD